MNISRKWLREFVDITATDKEYDSVMTLAGQKVETTERMDAEIKNVVVGKVLSMKKHENSDHMWVCMVDCGSGEPVQIVTGAQNVHEGDLVPVAQHNSYLPGGIHITKGKLRGVESCGMLCSYKELGLTEHDCPEAYADGIWILNDEGCEVGEDMNVVIGNDDSIVEFEITNNRPDCYSLIGLARETAAAFNVPMKHHEPVVKGGAEGVLPLLQAQGQIGLLPGGEQQPPLIPLPPAQLGHQAQVKLRDGQQQRAVLLVDVGDARLCGLGPQQGHGDQVVHRPGRLAIAVDELIHQVVRLRLAADGGDAAVQVHPLLRGGDVPVGHRRRHAR